MAAKRVLITGGDGFLGRALTRRLLGRGDYVWIVDDHSTSQPQAAHPRLVVHEADVCATKDRDLPLLDAILHFASPAAPALFVRRPRMSSAITSSLELASTPIRGPRRMRLPILRSSLVRRIVRSAIPIQNATWRPSPGRSWRVSSSRPTRNYGPSKPPRSSGSNDVSSWPKRLMSSSTRCSRTGAFPEARLTPRSAKPSLNLAARARSTAHQSSQTARFSDSCPPRPL